MILSVGNFTCHNIELGLLMNISPVVFDAESSFSETIVCVKEAANVSKSKNSSSNAKVG